MTSSPRIALVGGGPTSVYTLKSLVGAPLPLEVHLFEQESVAGPGMPYREGTNAPTMLSNIGSREVPEVVEGLEAWLKDCDDAALAEMGVARRDIDPESFHPRLVLGRYYTAQFAALVARGRARGHRIEIHTRTRVVDVIPGAGGPAVRWRRPDGTGEAVFDHVVLATGHDWPDQRTEDGVTLHSPWPAPKLARFRGQRVGILGSSLSGIDVAVGLAGLHGRFRRGVGGLEWQPRDGADGFSLAMLSRKGLIPEADWWYPVPLPPLPRLTSEAVAAEVARGTDGLLDRCAALLWQDLQALAPDYAARTGSGAVEGFAERHFADRMEQDLWAWAADNVAAARRDRRARRVSPARQTLLTAHEVFEDLTPCLGEADLDRFHRHLKPVFTDVYASVPHRSINRLLALHRAGRLEVVALGGSPGFAREDGHTVVEGDRGRAVVDAVVDARGQRSVHLRELGFAGLTRSVPWPPRGRPADFALALPEGTAGTVQCLALPVLLRRRPFVQGLPTAAAMGVEAAEHILARVAAATPKAAA